MTLSTALSFGNSIYMANDSLRVDTSGNDIMDVGKTVKIFRVNKRVVASIYGEHLGPLTSEVNEVGRRTEDVCEYAKALFEVLTSAAKPGENFGIHIGGFTEDDKRRVYHLFHRPGSGMRLQSEDVGQENRMMFLWNGANRELNESFPEMPRLWYLLEINRETIPAALRGLYDYCYKSVSNQDANARELVRPPYNGLILKPNSIKTVNLSKEKGLPVTTIARQSPNGYEQAENIARTVDASGVIVDPWIEQSSFTQDVYIQKYTSIDIKVRSIDTSSATYETIRFINKDGTVEAGRNLKND